ncbi:MAG: hypothetical protein E6J20_16540 [Chloroflexi bacterium]|nr:MAG: hypothetical protein E6J20_16540 [Chloroflexota bacterium]
MATRISVLTGFGLLLALSACDVLGLPATRALENGAAGMLGSAKSFEVAGSYVESGVSWNIDLQIVRPNVKHLVATSQGDTVEAVIIGPDAYFRGQQFLAKHLAGNPLGPSLARAAGKSWWKDAAGLAPSLPELTDGVAFRATFLGSAATQRTDHQPVSGLDAVELSGARADVFIASAPPYELLRVHLNKSVVIDGISNADLMYSNVDHDFKISAPTEVIDFGNLSTLPPIYTVVSVDTSGCGSPCLVSAKLKNLGGMTGALAPSTITFAMNDAANGQALGSCQARVQPDVGYNATTTVSCTIAAQATNAAVVTATADNPGRGV